VVLQLGYDNKDILARCKQKITVDGKTALIHVDFIIRFSGKSRMVIKYGPGSLITRHRPALAMACIIAPYTIPVVVVTNGKEADILDGKTGHAIASGLGSIPSKQELAALTESTVSEPVSAKQAEMAARIVFAFEIDDKCPCDDTHPCA
jgi:hypothetical protein